MRGTLGHESATQASVHVLSVYEVRTGLVLAQRSVAEKENEISAVKELLTPVSVKDRVWTADAMHTQKTACQRIDQLGGKYLFFFKDNHPTAHEDLALFFARPGCRSEHLGLLLANGKRTWAADDAQRAHQYRYERLVCR